MVKLMNSKLIQRRKQAIRAVMQACLPEFLNRIFLRMIGMLSIEPPKMIDYNTNLGSKLELMYVFFVFIFTCFPLLVFRY